MHTDCPILEKKQKPTSRQIKHQFVVNRAWENEKVLCGQKTLHTKPKFIIYVNELFVGPATIECVFSNEAFKCWLQFKLKFTM